VIYLQRRTLWSVLAVAFLALAVSALPAMAQTETPPGAMPANDAFGIAGDGADMGQEALRQLTQGVEDPLFGILEDRRGEVTGEYISFSSDQQTGAIQDYSMMMNGQQVPVFTNVTPEGFQPSETNVSGPLFTSTDGEFTIFAHDNPYGTLHIVGNGTVNMSLAEGFTAVTMQPDNPNAQAWMLTGQDTSGVLVVYNGTVQSNLAQSEEEGGGGIMEQITEWFQGLFGGGSESESQSSEPKFVEVTLPAEGALVYRGMPINDAFPRTDELALARQLANWSVEGEMAIMTADSTTLWYATEGGIMQPDVQATAGENVTVTLTPPEEVPSTFADASMQMYYVVAVDQMTLDAQNGTPTVMVNGEELTMGGGMDLLTGGNSTTFVMYEGKNATKFVIPLPMNATSGEVTIELSSGQTNASSSGPERTAAAAASFAPAAIALVGMIGVASSARRK